MKKLFLMFFLISTLSVLMPSIYSLQQNLVVNSNFTSGSSTGWTYSEDDPSGIATSEFNVSGGDDNPGVWYLESNDSETDSEYTIVGNLTNDGGVWSDPGTLISATVPFSYKQTWGLAAPSTNLIKVFLIKPDTSEVLLFSRSSTADDAAYSSESIDVGINNFSSTGTYKIKLYNYVETSVADTPLIRNFWDDIGLVLEYLDEVAPEITIESPSNKSYNITSVWANLTLDEDGDWCGYSLDGAANITMSNTSATDWYILVESLSESSHNIVYSCNDTSGNMNSSAVTIYFTVDLTDPQYSLNQTNSTEAGADTLFSLYWTDNIALAGYIFSFDNCTGIFENDSYIEMTGTGNWSNVSKWINSTVGCTIRWRVYANDTAGNMNVSDIYSFNTIDSTPPIITIEYPLNRSYNSTSVWANLTLNEDGDWCGYSLDGAANVTMSNTSTEDWYILVESLSESSHYITYSCNDTAGNMNSSEVTVYFSVDVTEPNLYISSPDNITYKDKQIDLNVSADEDIDAWRYSLNGNANVTFDPNTTITAAEGINNITVYANDTAGNLNSTTVYFSFNTTLEVVLEEPSTSFTTAIIQNTTFIVNATVICREGSCGDVSATVRYNKTSEDPDTPINITQGAEPLFIDEVSPLSTKSCPTNPLSENEYCNITWVLNATDSGLDFWKLDVNFSSDSGWTTKNNTLSSEIEVVPCIVDLTVTWSAIEFNSLTPNTYENPALGNDNNLYNITINDGSCNTDLYIKGTAMEDNDVGYVLGVGNLTWNNVSDSYATSYNMTDTYAPLKIDVPPLTNITTWYWINVPPIFAADYNGTVFIQGVMNGNPQP